jgi:hypothetical protein
MGASVASLLKVSVGGKLVVPDTVAGPEEKQMEGSIKLLSIADILWFLFHTYIWQIYGKKLTTP